MAWRGAWALYRIALKNVAERTWFSNQDLIMIGQAFVCASHGSHEITAHPIIILWKKLGGKLKWLPLDSRHHEGMHTAPITWADTIRYLTVLRYPPQPALPFLSVCPSASLSLRLFLSLSLSLPPPLSLSFSPPLSLSLSLSLSLPSLSLSFSPPLSLSFSPSLSFFLSLSLTIHVSLCLVRHWTDHTVPRSCYYSLMQSVQSSLIYICTFVMEPHPRCSSKAYSVCGKLYVLWTAPFQSSTFSG